MGVTGIGSVGSSTPITFNKIPYIDIEYPIPIIPNGVENKMPMNTVNDVIKEGINFFEHVLNIEMKQGEQHTMNEEEIENLISVLKGGVIYNGS